MGAREDREDAATAAQVQTDRPDGPKNAAMPPFALLSGCGRGTGSHISVDPSTPTRPHPRLVSSAPAHAPTRPSLRPAQPFRRERGRIFLDSPGAAPAEGPSGALDMPGPTP